MTEMIRLEGAPAPPLPVAGARPKRVPLMRRRSLVWLAVIGSVVAANFAFGTPHLRYEYSFTGPRDRPTYQRCVYVGFEGRRIVVPADGECPLIRLFQGGWR